jgi:hypothetical protein
LSSSRAANSRARFAVRRGRRNLASCAPSSSTGENRIDTNSSTPANRAKARNGNPRNSDLGSTESKNRYTGNAIAREITKPA